jgi:hypothetical protein
MHRQLGRPVLAGVLVAALGLGSAGCGAATSPGAGGTAPSATGLPAGIPTGSARYQRIAERVARATPPERAAFVQCMRSHGFPRFPGTFSLAALQAAGINLRSASFKSAAKACRSRLSG